MTKLITRDAKRNSRKFNFIFNFETNFRKYIEYEINRKSSVRRVLKAAPFAPNFGINKAFRIISINAAESIEIKYHSSLPKAMIKPLPKKPDRAQRKM